jgi:hypothetical protein
VRRATPFVLAASFVLALPSVAWSDGPSGAAGIVNGSGVGVSAGLGYKASPRGGGPRTAAPAGSGRPGYLGLIPHSCVPTTQPNVGISLSDVLYEAATADCVAFAAPSPVRRNGAPRDGDLDSVEELLAIAQDEAVALAEQPQLVLDPARRGITGLRSFFWLARTPQSVSATAEVPGLSVTAEAFPIRYIWDFGDGSRKSTTHAGRPWTRKRPGNVGHMYEVKGSYDVGVEVVWQARWRTGGGAWQPLGYFITADSHAYRVREVRPGLTRSRR